MSTSKSVAYDKNKFGSLGRARMCSSQVQSPSEKLKIIIDKKKLGKFFYFSKDENIENAATNVCENSTKVMSNSSPEDKGKKQKVVKLCCDCKAPNGLRPCTLPASGSSFIVETTTCFFDKLPPLKFGNYVQCLICGRRFEDEDYKHHDVLCKKKFNLYPDSETVEQRKFIKKSNRPRKYKPPFFMKTLRYDLEVDDCPRDQDLCGFFDY